MTAQIFGVVVCAVAFGTIRPGFETQLEQVSFCMAFFMFSPCLCGFSPGCLASSRSPSIIYRFVLHQRDAVPSPAVMGAIGGGPSCTVHQLSGFLPQSIDHLPICPPPEGRSAKPSCHGRHRRGSILHCSPVRSKH
ncbi:hypothetical protein JOB18_025340 [Solea senegalensis]|uniref:Secreted protein n=1 Tax=Solea senegalensis TaxID=28829 RepID=A0AAV6SGL3_SOLSE|nr:hypothetical protein JOB18_025340 [Solea senegalensis]